MINPFKKVKAGAATFEIKKDRPKITPAIKKPGDKAGPGIKAGEALKETELDKDIKRYRDLEGLSIKELELGYWYIKNKHNFIYAFEASLAIIGAITWTWFFYTYGHYIFVGMSADKKLAQELTRPNPEMPAAIRDQAARPVIVNSVQPIKNSLGTYDFAVNVTNPNPKHTADIRYSVNLGEQEIARGTGFIMPEESKYILVIGVEVNGNISDASFEVVGTGYTRITAHDFPNWEEYEFDHLNIAAANIEFTPAQFSSLSEKISLNDLSFVAVNNTVYDYYRVNFQILLFNQMRLVGINQIMVDKLKSGESRRVQLSWPGRLDRVSEVRIVPEIDIVKPDIYFKVDYAPSEGGG